MEGSVHDQATQVFVSEVHRRTHRGAEGLARAFAIRRLVFKEPGQRLHRVVLRSLDRIRAIMQALRHRATQQHSRAAQVEVLHRVNIRGAEDFLHALQHRVLQVRRFEDTARAFLLVRAVMGHPFLTENLKAELRPFEIASLCSAGERMCRRADADDRFARIQIAREGGKLRLGKLAEARADDHEIRIVEHLGAANVLLVVRVDVARLFIRGEEHDAIEAMRLRQDFCEHRHRLLRAILFIARDQHDGFSFASAARIGSDFEVVLGRHSGAQESQK